MATFSRRIPEKGIILAVFVACLIPVQFWSIFNVLREVPAWILRMSIWEMFGVIAYTQAFALFESALLTVFILAAAFILPGKLLRDYLAVSSVVIMLLLTIWLVILHYNADWIESRNALALGIWGVSFLTTLILGLWVSRKWQLMATSLEQILSRFMVLAGLFVMIDILSILIIVVRNIRF